MNIRVIERGDRLYPPLLARISDPPARLYCVGDAELLGSECVAVVGTRRCSPYGRWAAGEIAGRVSACGITVVSGMAAGIDSAAHLGCLSAGGRTIAVLGTGVDQAFPKSNRRLYDRIAAEGLLISEFEPGDGPLPWHFPQRNRIISGLSRAAVIVEGAEKSGSLITAGLALEQGRDVFAVPGNINQPNSRGVNKLIYDGACPITDLDDLPRMLGIDSASRTERALVSREEKKLLELISFSPGMSAGDLAAAAGLSPALAAGMITVLELKGLVRTDGNSLFLA